MEASGGCDWAARLPSPHYRLASAAGARDLQSGRAGWRTWRRATNATCTARGLPDLRLEQAFLGVRRAGKLPRDRASAKNRNRLSKPRFRCWIARSDAGRTAAAVLSCAGCGAGSGQVCSAPNSLSRKGRCDLAWLITENSDAAASCRLSGRPPGPVTASDWPKKGASSQLRCGLFRPRYDLSALITAENAGFVSPWRSNKSG